MIDVPPIEMLAASQVVQGVTEVAVAGGGHHVEREIANRDRQRLRNQPGQRARARVIFLAWVAALGRVEKSGDLVCGGSKLFSECHLILLRPFRHAKGGTVRTLTFDRR
jgi:hypothetical protein